MATRSWLLSCGIHTPLRGSTDAVLVPPLMRRERLCRPRNARFFTAAPHHYATRLLGRDAPTCSISPGHRPRGRLRPHEFLPLAAQSAPDVSAYELPSDSPGDETFTAVHQDARATVGLVDPGPRVYGNGAGSSTARRASRHCRGRDR